jgi:hypothetical protein
MHIIGTCFHTDVTFRALRAVVGNATPRRRGDEVTIFEDQLSGSLQPQTLYFLSDDQTIVNFISATHLGDHNKPSGVIVV